LGASDHSLGKKAAPDFAPWRAVLGWWHFAASLDAGGICLGWTTVLYLFSAAGAGYFLNAGQARQAQ